MRLIMIRHGASHHSAQKRIAGAKGCEGLTEQGVRQVEALAQRLRATGELRDCAALLTSPWRRARETAVILMPTLGVAAMEDDQGLCELEPGASDGLTREEYRTHYEEFDPQSFPERPVAPGGDSWASFVGRVDATLHRLSERFAGQTVVTVTHAGFIVVAFLLVLDNTTPRPGVNLWLDPEHTALTEWQVSGTTWKLSRYNDAFHLLNVQ